MTVQAFWALEDPCCRCIWLQGYLFRAQKQKKYRLTSFFVFNHTDKCDGIRFSTKCCVLVLFFNSGLWCSSRDKGDDRTYFVSFRMSLLQVYKASRILIQSSEMEGRFHSFFSFSDTSWLLVEKTLGRTVSFSRFTVRFHFKVELLKNEYMTIVSKLKSDISNRNYRTFCLFQKEHVCFRSEELPCLCIL